jgi:hypothetical protein
MGGYSSGRYRTKTFGTVDAVIRIDMRVLRQRGLLRPGATSFGTLSWHRAVTNDDRGSVSVRVDLTDPSAGSLTVTCNVNGEPFSQTISIVGKPMRYGGHRYYFVCPVHGRRCEVLPFAHKRFASRQAQRLNYSSQSDDFVDRLRERARRLEKRLHPTNKRRRLRGDNYERLVRAWISAEVAFEDAFASYAARRFGGLFEEIVARRKNTAT